MAMAQFVIGDEQAAEPFSPDSLRSKVAMAL
jgi:hypothetical protein